jgi:TM2 domain-containing membrane protein YozV
MFCRNCGKQIHEKAIACPGCGVPPLLEHNYCPHCGAETAQYQSMCIKCGGSLGGVGAAGSGSNDKIAAALLAIFVGCFGVHKFYLGYTKEGVIMLVVSLAGGIVTCGIATAVIGIIGLIEGIIYLTKSDDEFRQMYVLGRKAWF